MEAGAGGQHRMARPYSQDLLDRVIGSVASGRTCGSPGFAVGPWRRVDMKPATEMIVGQARGGTELAHPTPRQINPAMCEVPHTHSGIGELLVVAPLLAVALERCWYAGRHAENQSVEPERAEGRARPAPA